MEKLKHLVIHCSATPEGRNIKGETVIGWHTAPKPRGRGWRRGGYSHIIELDGNIYTYAEHDADGWVESNEMTNGVLPNKGVSNSNSLHICYIGGLSKDGKTAEDTRTLDQLQSMSEIVLRFISLYPNIKILGHNQVANKACPSFDVPKWLRELGVQNKNIF